ncbi:QueT transporter family protein [Serpentinicella sp. ANB-PHB4]|uniref:QueT transporter family protein n=1 Tax=Serpentinicella sp. ANB-PHB4 TaxID=3074076 RepID=UPI00285C9EFF|nr:QueT transporter family protein [Serpentinicella sp. ANB-PHB4]MDR5659731.1 QueT transporter family protein [Serpentinicella sp. ANB-PHB4]
MKSKTSKGLKENSESIPLVRKLTISGIVMALYITIMIMTQHFAFGQYQIRVATSIYGLGAIYPFLIIPLGLSNLLSNTLMGGLGIFDIVGGFIVGVITTSAVYFIKKLKLSDWLIAIPIILGPGLIVPIWLSYLIGVPYQILATSIIIGQIIPGILGVLLVKNLRHKI